MDLTLSTVTMLTAAALTWASAVLMCGIVFPETSAGVLIRVTLWNIRATLWSTIQSTLWTLVDHSIRATVDDEGESSIMESLFVAFLSALCVTATLFLVIHGKYWPKPQNQRQSPSQTEPMAMSVDCQDQDQSTPPPSPSTHQTPDAPGDTIPPPPVFIAFQNGSPVLVQPIRRLSEVFRTLVRRDGRQSSTSTIDLVDLPQPLYQSSTILEDEAMMSSPRSAATIEDEAVNWAPQYRVSPIERRHILTPMNSRRANSVVNPVRPRRPSRAPVYTNLSGAAQTLMTEVDSLEEERVEFPPHYIF